MTSPKIRTEINDILNQLPESSLKYALEILKEIQSNPSNNNSVDNFREALAKNKKLLKNLTE